MLQQLRTFTGGEGCCREKEIHRGDKWCQSILSPVWSQAVSYASEAYLKRYTVAAVSAATVDWLRNYLSKGPQSIHTLKSRPVSVLSAVYPRILSCSYYLTSLADACAALTCLICMFFLHTLQRWQDSQIFGVHPMPHYPVFPDFPSPPPDLYIFALSSCLRTGIYLSMLAFFLFLVSLVYLWCSLFSLFPSQPELLHYVLLI